MSRLQAEIGTLRTIAFWLGGLVIVMWAWRDLHRGLLENEMRYATQHDRYLLGGLVYAGGAFIIYYIVIQTTIAGLQLMGQVGTQGDPYQSIPVSLVAVLVIVVLLPEAPVVRESVKAFRRLCRALALYPHALMRFSRLLRRKDAGPNQRAGDALEQELDRYGVGIRVLTKQVSSSTLRDLEEIQLVREHLNSLVGNRSNSWRIFDLAGGLPAHLLFRNPFPGASALSKLVAYARAVADWHQTGKLHRFLIAREYALQRSEQLYQKLLRQLAQVCILEPNVVPDEDNPYPLSTPVVSATNELLSRYRTLVSEAALSCFSGRRRRRRFIEGLGYSALPDWSLPYWPLLAVFVLDAGLFLAPLVLGLVPAAPPPPDPSTPLTSTPATTTLGINVILPFLFSHGFAQVVAVSWAVLPKTSSNFARPSLSSYPYASYLLFGTCSFITGISVMLINTAALDHIILGGVPRIRGINPYVTAVIFSIYFPAITVCVALLTDLHLRSRTFARTQVLWLYRARDAVVAGALMAVVNVLFVRQAIFLLSGSPSPDKYYVFAYVVGGIGFAIGLLFPATAAAYLHATEAIRPPGVGLRPSSRKTRRGPSAIAGDGN